MLSLENLTKKRKSNHMKREVPYQQEEGKELETQKRKSQAYQNRKTKQEAQKLISIENAFAEVEYSSIQIPFQKVKEIENESFFGNYSDRMKSFASYNC